MSSAVTRRKIIIDTDPGVDDANAIIGALADDSAEIIALTTVAGNAGLFQVTKNLKKLLQVCGRTDIPVYMGAKHALLGGNFWDPEMYHGKDGFGDVRAREGENVNGNSSIKDEEELGGEELADKSNEKEHAAHVLWNYVKLYPDEITLIAIGPLTNIALAIRLYPEFGSKLKDCFLLGGNTTGEGNVTPSGEFNFYSDPEAAKIVLTELGCSITLICWELCLKNKILWSEYDELRRSSKTIVKFLTDIEKHSVWKCREDKLDGFVLCDQLAVFAALRPEVVRQTKLTYATVELTGKETRGQMVVDWNGFKKKPPNVRIVTEMDKSVIYQCCRRVLYCAQLP